jgi:hypothetical protein
MAKQIQQDPLQEILERHLIRSSTEGEQSSTMIQAVVDDYLEFLTSQGSHIPMMIKETFIEDLKEDIRESVIKRTFGAVSPSMGKPVTPKIKRLNRKDI